MDISLKAPLLKMLVEQNKNPYLKLDSYNMQARLELPIGHKHTDKENYGQDGYEADDVFKFNLIDVKDSELSPLVKALEAIKAPTKTIDTVKRWMEVLKNPANGDVSTIQGMDKIFGKLLSKLPNKWLLLKGEDEEVNPVLVKSTKYYAPHGGEYAYYEIDLIYGYLFPEKEDKAKACSTVEYKASWNKYDINKEEAGEVPSYLKAYSEDSDKEIEEEEEELTDDDVKPKRGKQAVTKKVKLSELLAMRKLFIPTKDDMLRYDAAMKLQNKISAEIGIQYTATGTAYEVREGEYRGMNLKPVGMMEDDVPNKVVINTSRIKGGVTRGIATEKYGTQPLPYHPYVKAYDITKYRDVAVHVSKLEKYVYNPKLINSLILPDADIALLNALIAGEVTFNDIIAGKSGGIIILGSGPAGTGKTLTAEVLSEVVGKPLYQVQSAQLGLTPKEIEENLYLILKRADKWKALLLIDESDSYVSERGDDMVQNAVVGVFLRLFEYYKGILFLTTNRHDKIDSAIISRLTAHLKYGIPTRENQIKIFDVIAGGYKIKADKAEVEKIIDKYPHMVGRDIRNVLKLLKKFNHKEREGFVLKADMLKAVESFIPFVNKIDTADAKPSKEMQKAVEQMAEIYFDLNYDEATLTSLLSKKKIADGFVREIVAALRDIIRNGKKK